MINKLYKHKKKGTQYLVLSMGNENATDLEKFPVMVSYTDGVSIWMRPLKDFLESCEEMTLFVNLL